MPDNDVIVYYQKLAEYVRILKVAGKTSNLSDERIDKDVFQKQKEYQDFAISIEERIRMLEQAIGGLAWSDNVSQHDEQTPTKGK